MGRFMSPDPGSAGANPANPQSWNAYAYVLDNPETLTDPFGLAVCSWQNGGGFSEEDLAVLAGIGGAGCAANGVVTGCGLVSFELGSGAAAGCPNGECSGFGTDGSVNVSFAQFFAFDFGLSGYFRPSDLANGMNDFNGTLYSGDWQSFLRWAYAGSISAQRQRLLVNLARLKYAHVTVSQEPLFIKGGHANFQLMCEAGTTCSLPAVGRYGYGVHVREPGIVHDDTFSSWKGSFSLGDIFTGSFWEHGFVDLFGGSFTTVFPQ